MALRDLAFPPSNWIHSVEVIDSCPSTSDVLRERLKSDLCDSNLGKVLVARNQTQGRGRETRDWWTGPPDSNIALTACLSPPEPPLVAGLLAACAMAKVGEEYSNCKSALKWPNDVLLKNDAGEWAKFCGILSELIAGQPNRLLVGVGANILQAPPSDVAPYPTTCVGSDVDLGAFLQSFLEEWEKSWALYQGHGPKALEKEFFTRLTAWAPKGIRIPEEPDLPTGRLLEFSVSKGLSWGKADNYITRPLGLLPSLEAL